MTSPMLSFDGSASTALYKLYIPGCFERKVGRHLLWRLWQAEPCRPLHLVQNSMPDNVIAIAPAAPWAFPHIGRHARSHRVKERPACPHERQFSLQFILRYSLLINTRKCKRDSPKVGRTAARISFDDIDAGER